MFMIYIHVETTMPAYLHSLQDKEYHRHVCSFIEHQYIHVENEYNILTLNCEVFPDTYNVFRRDRDPEVKANGGGVFILVKKIYVSSEIRVNTKCELVFVDLELKDQQNVKIGCVYLPP